MKRGHGKKLSAIVIGAILATFILASQAFAWGSATHAYIDDRLGKQGPIRNLNEIYGGMATDVFNYLFVNLDWLNYLYMETHYDHNMVVWKKADTILEKAVAFGFVSHNGYTGADATAHGSYDYTLQIEPTGWVIAKTVDMTKKPEVQTLLNGILLGEPDNIAAVTYELCHTFVESAVDLLLAQQDRSLGGKISVAALARTHEFPNLLVKAYARGFAKRFGVEYAMAVQTVRSAESEFRRNMVSYGLALAQDAEIAKGLIAEQLVALAPAFLGAYGVELSDDADLAVLSNNLIDAAIDLCQEDYLTAVEGTILFVKSNLPHMGRFY
jgi:hypothetical protein